VQVRMTCGHEAIVKLADAAGCAVAVMPDAKGMFPENHPNFVGTAPTQNFPTK
jgi:pyruvate decarboxylase